MKRLENKVNKAEEIQLSDVKIWYKNFGRKSHHFGKRIIKPGEKFLMAPNSIPREFRDTICPMNDTDEKPITETALRNVAKPVYKKQPRGKSQKFFDVLSPEGKRINEEPLESEEADKLVTDLMK